MASNYERLIRLAEESFDPANNPDVLDVDEAALERLRQIDSATVSEESDENGPVAWILIFPTTSELMEAFVRKEISESELLYRSPLDADYDAVYLCSALVLEEYRRRGITKRLAENALEKLMAKFPIRTLFAWPFSNEGRLAAEKIAHDMNLSLIFRS